MIAPLSPAAPRCQRPIVLFDRSLAAMWTNAPDFAHAGKQPWDFCIGDDAEIIKTAFSRCLAKLDVAPFSACLALEGRAYRYQIEPAYTGCDDVPVIAVCQWYDGRADLLTARERQIALLTVDGLTAKEIGEKLGISGSTVDTHRNRIEVKLGLPSICALGQWAAFNLPREGAYHE